MTEDVQQREELCPRCGKACGGAYLDDGIPDFLEPQAQSAEALLVEMHDVAKATRERFFLAGVEAMRKAAAKACRDEEKDERREGFLTWADVAGKCATIVEQLTPPEVPDDI